MTNLVGGRVELSATFTVAGAPADPTSVALVVRRPDGTEVDPAPTPDNPEPGLWTHVLEPDMAGRWAWTFEGTGNEAAQVVMGACYVQERFANPQMVCSVDEVEDALAPRALTAAEQDRVGELIAQLVDTLEIRLNRWLYPRTTTQTTTVGADGRLVLHRGPVRRIVSVEVDGVALGAGDPGFLDPVGTAFGWGSVVAVTYEAGDDPTPAATGLVRDVIERSVLAGATASSGALKSYSVEGTSITYGDVSGASSSSQSGRITVGDIRSLGRLRRPVVRW